jgi:hypothetical protein
MSAERITTPDWLLFVFAMPISLVWGLCDYAKLGKGRAEKIGIVISFIPGILVLSLAWGMAWALALLFILKLITGDIPL